MPTPEPTPPHVLVLVRHGKAASDPPPGSDDGDHARELLPRGAEQVVATAGWLTDTGRAQPDLVLVSSAARAAQTWAAMAAVLHPGTVREEPRLYETSPGELTHLVAQTPDDVTSLLLVGHEPVVSGTASLLAGPASDADALTRVAKGVSTGAVVVLELDGPWSSLEPGSARLVGHFAP